MYPIYVLLVPLSPNCYSILLYDQPFLSSTTLKDRKMILNPARSNVHHIYITSDPKSQIQPVSLYNQPFSSYGKVIG